MTQDQTSIIRAMSRQNNEISELVCKALSETGRKVFPGKSLREYVTSLITAYRAEIRANRMEKAQDVISTRPTFFQAGKRVFRLDAVSLIEFGQSHGEEKITRVAKVHLNNGEVIYVTGRYADNIRAVMTKETGTREYDVHHLIDLSRASSAKTGAVFIQEPSKNEQGEFTENNELHSADGERGAEISGGETT